MQTLTEIRTLLEEWGLSPKHKLGQNFLVDHNLITKLVDASGVQTGDLVLEVGPGTGTMTEELLDRGCEVVACELDADMAGILRERLGERQNFMLIEGDCLASKHEISREVMAKLDGRVFRLVANLPYGAATPLMLALLTDVPACQGQFVTIQREVADRLMAKPGGKMYGVISVVAQLFAQVELVAKLPKECFWPQPEIASAMVSIVPRVSVADEEVGRKLFAQFCQKLFNQRRKQLGSVLKGDGALPAGFDVRVRAETLTPEGFLDLYRWHAAR
ncbi:MAG: ribosomal RNA small subunit methyltransferase A [Phycisphaerales bacterium]|nr:ribosomal RNA small subunit methyltransferase A [Phycisphaerales bacterium]MCB9837027.1 ribosomal RNA small subunit methyltransferase A [Phycisphaera sp.]